MQIVEECGGYKLRMEVVGAAKVLDIEKVVSANALHGWSLGEFFSTAVAALNT